MDWFHCNRCFRQEGAAFAVTSCGHVLCAACGGAGPCPVCAAACRYLPVSDKMRPQEKLFFKSPSDIALKRLTLLSQAWRFQRAQADLLLAGQKEAARRARAALEDARHLLQDRERELEALRRENGELRRAQLSPGWRGGGSRSSTPRPVGVTSPAQTVPPQPRRQLSGQVVSRSAPPERPPSRRTPPPWQVGGAYRGLVTPPASASFPWATPPLPAAIFPGETPPPFPRPPPRA